MKHEIVHNKHVVKRLSEDGAIFVEAFQNVPKNSIVIFSAHGVAKKVVNEAKEVLDNFKVLQKEAENEAENIILRARENAKQLQITAEENSKKFISRQEEQIKQKIKAAEKQALLDVKNLVVDLSVEATKEYLIKEIDEKHSNKLVLDSSKTLNKSI